MTCGCITYSTVGVLGQYACAELIGLVFNADQKSQSYDVKHVKTETATTIRKFYVKLSNKKKQVKLVQILQVRIVFQSGILSKRKTENVVGVCVCIIGKIID